MVGRTPWNIWRKEDILEKWILAWNTANSSHEVSNGTATLSLQWDLYASHSSNSMLASALLYCLPNKPGQAVLIQTGSFGCFTCIFSFLENSGSPSLTSEQWKQLITATIPAVSSIIVFCMAYWDCWHFCTCETTWYCNKYFVVCTCFSWNQMLNGVCMLKRAGYRFCATFL